MDLDFADPTIRFFVHGRPSPGGSKRFVGMSKRTGRAVLIDAGGKHTKNWRACVAATAREVAPAAIIAGAVTFSMRFVMARPKYHFHTSKKLLGQLRSEYAAAFHDVAPDTTKLVRSTEDALKGIVWVDDCQVVRQFAEKTYGETPGCQIEITPL